MQLTQLVGLFNIGTGVLFVFSLLFFCAGFLSWMLMLGRERRSLGEKYMVKGVETLFALVVILYAVQMFQKHVQIATALVAAAIIIYIGWHIVPDLLAGEEEKKPEKK